MKSLRESRGSVMGQKLLVQSRSNMRPTTFTSPPERFLNSGLRIAANPNQADKFVPPEPDNESRPRDDARGADTEPDQAPQQGIGIHPQCRHEEIHHGQTPADDSVGDFDLSQG